MRYLELGALVLVLAGCSSPLGLPPDYAERTWGRPGRSVPLPPPEEPRRDARPLEGLTLEQARHLCLQRNHTLAAARAAVEAARARIAEARAALLPELSLSIQRTAFREVRSVTIPGTGASFSLSPQVVTTGQASLTLSLFAFGRDIEMVKAARAELGTQMLDERGVRQQLLLEVTQAWYRLHEALAQVGVARDALTASARQLQDAINTFEAERATPDAVPTARVDWLRRRQQLLQAENAATHARRVLNVLLAREVDAPLTLAEAEEFSPVELPRERLKELAREHNPSLLAFRTRRLALEHRRESLTRSWMPEMVGSLNAEYTDFTEATGYATNYSATLGFQWKPLDAGRRIGKLDEIHASMAQLREQQLQAIQELDLDIEKVFLDLEEAESAVELARQAIEAAAESHRIISDRFRAGKTTSREVLEAQAVLTDSRFTYNQARFAHRMLLARLEALVGVSEEDWTPSEQRP